MNQSKIFNGKKYYLSSLGVQKDYAYEKAKDLREMGHNARVVKIGEKYFVYSR